MDSGTGFNMSRQRATPMPTVAVTRTGRQHRCASGDDGASRDAHTKMQRPRPNAPRGRARDSADVIMVAPTNFAPLSPSALRLRACNARRGPVLRSKALRHGNSLQHLLQLASGNELDAVAGWLPQD